ncbi:MAG: cyclase family protein, partial [Solirubrobacterales bacterium]|nr:cyclase family protein [Solirubrobacterales bacterium]
HARHLLRTEDWLLALDPEAAERLRLAAVLHDIERAFPDPDVDWDSARDWDSAEYNRWHQERCAAIAARWLREQAAPDDLVAGVQALIRVHEEGGWPEADLLQAADSLSFLDTLTPLVISWVQSGRATPERAVAKVRSSLDRIDPSLEHARELAQPMLDEALRAVQNASAENGGAVSPPSRRGGSDRGIVRPGQPAADAAAPTPAHVLAGVALIREGRMYRLARERFPRMPLFPGHPTFEVVSYRTPHGSRVTGDHHWGLPNDACLGYMSELVIGTTHTGAHIDAHAHMTVGEDDRWHGGTARTQLGDFGPVVGDATEIPPLWRRGVLYDVPGHRGISALGAGEPITADELLAIEAATGVAAGRGDVALVRTGYLSGWPDPDRLAASRGAGPDISAARLLLERGVVATGTDTETYEVQPAPDRGMPANPQPVHTLLLIEHGIYLLESLDLEGLAAAGAREFLFVALPLAIRGATGSMVDPVAIT